ncbi:MAG: PKD domain-containing protein [Bacteroidota bacterium]|nr:PKD domain-containing protein [Bacteroidota bacterium]
MKKLIFLFTGTSLLNSCSKAPESCFSYSPATISAGSIVTFNPNCSKNASSFKWNFGDNTKDTTLYNNNLVTHIYKTAGNYTVKLSVGGKDGVTLKKGKLEKSLTIFVH